VVACNSSTAPEPLRRAIRCLSNTGVSPKGGARARAFNPTTAPEGGPAEPPAVASGGFFGFCCSIDEIKKK